MCVGRHTQSDLQDIATTDTSGLEGSSGRGQAGKLAKFIENSYCLHHVQHAVLRSNTDGLNWLSMVLTQSATGCRMDWL